MKGRILVRKIRSEIGRDPRTRARLKVLGLRKIGDKKEFTVTPELQGTLRKLGHLVEITEIK